MPDTTIPNTNLNQPTSATPAPPNSLASSLTRVHLIIRNRKRIIFEDDVKSLTSLNDKGIFDVLPQHENFISIIKQYVTIHQKDGQMQTITIQNGVLRVKANQINCYIDLLAKPQTTSTTPPRSPGSAGQAGSNPPTASNSPNPQSTRPQSSSRTA